MYARVRKYGAIPTGITQNVETLLDRTEGRKLLNNSEFVVLLKQKGSDARELAVMYELTESQLRYVTKPKAKEQVLLLQAEQWFLLKTQSQALRNYLN